MSTLLSSLTGFLAFFFSSFIFWRRLREDYAPGKIFSFTLILLVGGVMGSFIARLLSLPTSGILAAFSFWLPFLLVSLLTLYLVKKLDLGLFEVLDSLVPSGLLFMAIYSLGRGFDVGLLTEAGLALFGLVIYRFFRGRYRRFSWYPSGKVGFLGLATLCLYFFARFLVAIFFLLAQASPVVLSFSERGAGFKLGASDFTFAIISLILFIFFLLAVYLRSGRPGAERFVLKWSNLHFG